MSMLQSNAVNQFQNYLLRWFTRHGRHELPWRQSYHPYYVIVSELMLQQTQVDRVVPKFVDFISELPTVHSLAVAPTSQVIKLWQGLGYNRRALNLQKSAQKVVSEFDGMIPQSTDELLTLPGIGPYTASAVRAFAFNQPTVVIETNIRAVYIHHFFPDQEKVSDEELTPFIEQTMPENNPREWYGALMDYGSYLKKVLPNPTRKSKTHTTQSSFEGSNRQLRGSILREVTTNESISNSDLIASLPEKELFSSQQIKEAIKTLIDEGFLEQKDTELRLSS